eukprot:323679_1
MICTVNSMMWASYVPSFKDLIMVVSKRNMEYNASFNMVQYLKDLQLGRSENIWNFAIVFFILYALMRWEYIDGYGYFYEILQQYFLYYICINAIGNMLFKKIVIGKWIYHNKQQAQEQYDIDDHYIAGN